MINRATELFRNYEQIVENLGDIKQTFVEYQYENLENPMNEDEI